MTICQARGSGRRPGSTGCDPTSARMSGSIDTQIFTARCSLEGRSESMNAIAFLLLGFAALLVLYAYAIYPLVLYLIARFRRAAPGAEPIQDWPHISISLPVYNEEGQIGEVIESLLAIDYPE